MRLAALVLIAANTFLLFGMTQVEPVTAQGQPIGKMGPIRGSARDPFILPAGIRLLSKSDTPAVFKKPVTSGTLSTLETKPKEIPLKVSAILIGEHIRLASIDHHIVAVGDTIHDERILEIEKDRVVVGKGDKKRTLLLSQNSVQLTVEEK